jgi:hypothetical protein
MSSTETSLAWHYQNSLIYMSLEDSAASELLPLFQGGRYGGNYQSWQREVAKLIGVALTAEFVQIKDGLGYFTKNTKPADVEAIYLHSSVQDDLLWMGVQFVATPKLKQLLADEHLNSWDALQSPLNQRFLENIPTLK